MDVNPEIDPKEISPENNGNNEDNSQLNEQQIESTTGADDGTIAEENSDDITNDNPDNEDNNDPNEAMEESADIFTLMYGNEEELDEESEPEETDGHSLSHQLNTETANSMSSNQNKRAADPINASSKRRSDESELFQSKRIKSEPTEKLNEANGKQMTTTVEEVLPEDEPSPPEIPKTTLEFMSYILDLNANDLESNQSHRFSMSRNYRNISQILRFSDLNEFQNTFIPYILTDLWRKLNYKYSKRQKSFANIMNLKYFLSILTKTKSSKMKNGLDMRCISVVRPKEGPVFKFGQLITIQTAVQPKPNSSTHIITRRQYFGYITSHSIRATNVDNQSEVNHLKLLNESRNNSVIVEEITFMTKYSDELYLRNDALIVAEPIVCVHNTLMEARIVYKFNEFPIGKQIFNPIFSSKPSGLTVTVNEKKFNRNEVEMIQKALDVVANDSFANSCFLAINGSKKSAKTSVLIEIIRQIVGCKGLDSNKVLFCCPEYNSLQNVNQILKSKRIRTYFIEKDIEESLREFAIKHIENKLSKDKDSNLKSLYEQCLQYFESGNELSSETILFKYKILEHLRTELLENCSVIIGRIDDICNDISFYRYFTQPNHLITCCIADDSMSISEPQLYSLFHFGIKKFLFGGNFENRSDDNITDICRDYGLSRSFFERYYSLHCQTDGNNQSTVFDI